MLTARSTEPHFHLRILSVSATPQTYLSRLSLIVKLEKETLHDIRKFDEVSLILLIHQSKDRREKKTKQ